MQTSTKQAGFSEFVLGASLNSHIFPTPHNTTPREENNAKRDEKKEMKVEPPRSQNRRGVNPPHAF